MLRVLFLLRWKVVLFFLLRGVQRSEKKVEQGGRCVQQDPYSFPLYLKKKLQQKRVSRFVIYIYIWFYQAVIRSSVATKPQEWVKIRKMTKLGVELSSTKPCSSTELNLKLICIFFPRVQRKKLNQWTWSRIYACCSMNVDPVWFIWSKRPVFIFWTGWCLQTFAEAFGLLLAKPQNHVVWLLLALHYTWWCVEGSDLEL